MSTAQAKTASLMDRIQLQKLLEENPKKKIGATLLNTAYDVALGVGAGGLLGALMGKHSFWPGLILTGTGYYFDVRAMQVAGLGMMASSHLLAPNERAARTKEGFDFKAELQDAKSRAQKFGKSLLERTYADKLVSLVKRKKDQSAESTDTTSAQDTIPTTADSTQPVVNGLGEPDYSQLDKISQQIVSNAVAYQRANPEAGTVSIQPAQMNGLDEEIVTPDKW